MTVAIEEPSRSTRRMSPAMAIVWQIVRGNRTAICVALGGWAVAALFANTVLAHALATYDSLWRVGLGLMVAIFAAFLPLLVSAWFSLGVNVEETLEGYPRCLLRTPVTSAMLAGLPIALGLVAVSLSWIAVEKAVLLPLGTPVSLFPSTLGFAGGLLLMQAICWAPVGKGFKIPLFGLVLGTLIGGAVLIGVRGLSHGWFTGLYAVLSIVAGALAYVGLGASRRGDIYELESIRRLGQRLAAVLNRRPGFQGVDGPNAQYWFDRSVEGFPLFGAVIWLVLVTSPSLLGSAHPTLVDGGAFAGMPIASVTCMLWVKVMTFAPIVAVLLAAILGINPLASTYGFRRPLTSQQVAWTKLRGALWGVWWTLGFLAAIAAVAMLTPADSGSKHGFLGALLLTALDRSAIAPIAFGIVCYVLWILRARVDCMWMSVLKLGGAGAIHLLLPGFILVACIIVENATGNSVWPIIMDHIGAIAVVGLVAKIATYIAVIRLLARRGLTDISTIGRQVAIWVAGSVLMAWLGSMALPTMALSTIVCLSITAVPMARAALLPWAVDRARHQ